MGCPEGIQDIVTEEKLILLLKDRLVGHSLFWDDRTEFLLDQKSDWTWKTLWKYVGLYPQAQITPVFITPECDENGFFFFSRKFCSSDKFSWVWEGSALLGSLGKAVAVLAIRELHCNLGLSVSCLYLQLKNVYVSQVCVPTSIIATELTWYVTCLLCHPTLTLTLKPFNRISEVGNPVSVPFSTIQISNIQQLNL